MVKFSSKKRENGKITEILTLRKENGKILL